MDPALTDVGGVPEICGGVLEGGEVVPEPPVLPEGDEADALEDCEGPGPVAFDPEPPQPASAGTVSAMTSAHSGELG